MAKKLNWGVLGNATIARVCVIPAIQKSRNGTLYALASRSPDLAADVIRQHKINRIYGDYQTLIEDPHIEAVYIPLPNHLHHEWTLKALASGKHVLCEKPLACDTQQAQEMGDAAHSAGRLLMEGFMYRFHPRSRKIRQLVHAGAIGMPHLIRSAFCYRMSSEDIHDPHNARIKSEKGGGALLDVGCYSVSIARWLFDAEPHQVQCQASFHPAGADVHVAGILCFGDQRLATFEASFIAGLQQTYTVVGENGVVELPHDAFIPWEKDALYTLRKNEAETAAPTVIPGADEYQLMVEHFVDAVRGDAALAYTASDSIGNMRVIDALAASARTHQVVKL